MGYFQYLIFMLPALIISMAAQAGVQSAFKKYSNVGNARGLTGAEAARRVLSLNGITNVHVEAVQGNLTDHFDPRSNVIRLSDAVYSQDTVAAVGVAAHEAGHAVQYAAGYVPIRLRSAMVPVTQFSSNLSMPLILIGYFMAQQPIILAGIILFSLSVLFSIVTLPVEFNASSRAIKTLEESGTLYGEELEGARAVLKAAAMTYLAATFTALWSLLRLLLIFGGRGNRND